MIGRTVSHYRILSTLGAGGMGVVYLAEDARLGRQVALKFLPASWASEARALDRFRVEARAASSLSHPGICAIYDIGQDGDTPFIVMEALKGETLRERIGKGPLKVADVLDVGIQLTDALEAAHAQGIVHRDIKPANIFLGDRNRVKVLDFGLAKVTAAASSLSSASDTASSDDRRQRNQITQPGTALGTVSYMSPEQARGEAIDSRTDLFSLGAVLYEMVTGSQAFGGTTTAVVYDAILNRAPRPIAQLNPLIPARLEAVIATALEKDPDLRYQHASDFQAELRRIRRDLESGSIASSQSLASTSRASGMTIPVASPEKTNVRRQNGIMLVVAVAAIGRAAILFWRSGEPTPATTPPPQAVSRPENIGAESRAAAPPEAEARPAPAPPPLTAPQSPKPAPPAPNSVRPPANVAMPDPVRPGAAPASTLPPAMPSPPLASTPPPPAAPVPSPAAPVPETDAPKAQTETPPQPVVLPPVPVQQPAPPARGTAPTVKPQADAVETDDAAIRRVIRIFERAIETEDIALYRSYVRIFRVPQKAC